MRRMLFIIVVGVALLALARPVAACPSCRDAVPSSSDADEDDQTRESRAYNNSIYLMAGMPYLLLGMVGFGVYRYARKHQIDDIQGSHKPDA